MNTRHKNPFPASEPLLKCFDIALTDEEIDFLIRLGTEPCTYEKAASLSPLSEDAFDTFFETLIRKGVLWPQETGEGPELYTLSGIMLGWFEVYLSDGEETPEKREFARSLDDLLKSFGRVNSFPWKILFNYRFRRSQPFQSILAPGRSPERGQGRTIEVGRTLGIDPTKVLPSRNVEELIEKYGDGNSIAVLHCFCRQYHKMIGQQCRFQHPPQSCLTIGSLSRHAVRYGIGQFLSKSEALALVRELQARGAVHQIFHKDEDIHNPEIAICNCCWDCCGVFGSYNRGFIPLNLHSFYEARLPDPSLCNGCATCVDYCPVQAITLEEDKCRIDGKKCIGCGQCELHCPENAIQLIANERRVFLPLVKKSEARIRE
jgi:ferredoxin